MKRYITDESNRLACTKLVATPCPKAREMQLVKVYPHITFQQIIGFGAALTEASGYVYAHMDEATQRSFIQLCFGTEGNRYSFGRLSVQSCDFSLVPRSYASKPKDASLQDFSIDDDYAYVLPLVLAACSENENLEFIASPWSPPAWAKTTRSMKRGGHLLRKHYDTWAQMMARFVAEYRSIGVPVTRLTVQNEPEAIQTWESCLFSASQERTFLHEHLKPALRELGLDDVKVLIWDHNKQSALERAAGLLSDGQAGESADGVAFHWYSGDHFEALRVVRDAIGPQRELVFTEGCEFYSAGSSYWELPHAENYAHEIIGDLEAGANGILDWNILLDEKGGPNHVGNYCDAPIMYDMQTHEMNVRLPFYYLGHFSRFIQPGARRMLTTRYTSDLETCSFVNPDGSHALVVLNRTDRTVPFTLTWGMGLIERRAASTEAPPRSIQTIVW